MNKTEMIDISTVFRAAIIVVALVVTLMIGLIFATGSTFGQRCKKITENPIQFEQCIVDLKAGRVPLSNRMENVK